MYQVIAFITEVILHYGSSINNVTRRGGGVHDIVMIRDVGGEV